MDVKRVGGSDMLFSIITIVHDAVTSVGYMTFSINVWRMLVERFDFS